MRVENSNIKKVLSNQPPHAETVGSIVKACTILSVRCGTCKHFPSDGLQFRFNANITANFCQKIGSQNPDFVVLWAGSHLSGRTEHALQRT